MTCFCSGCQQLSTLPLILPLHPFPVAGVDWKLECVSHSWLQPLQGLPLGHHFTPVFIEVG